VRYSASCGGHGEDNDAIWGGEPDPSLRGRPDVASGGMSRITGENVGAFLDGGGEAWCSKGRLAKPRFRWTERISESELTARVATRYPEVGRVKQLIAKQRGVSGRIGVLAIKGDKASVEVTGDLHIRRLLGGLKSTLFEVERQGDSFVIRGGGYGHGVGMCQMGAIGMATAGKTHAQILAHYYRGSHLHRLY
jgi:stage II sporulation protein D